LLKIFHDPASLNHQPGTWHPESPARLTAVMEVCRSLEGVEIAEECRRASRDEIELVHKASYYDYIESLAGQHAMLDPDTEISPGSFEASLKAVGAVLQAVDFVSQDKKNRAFCAVRPPGHHAEADHSKGFCIFNNIAIGAAYAMKSGLTSRIAIVDWDVHHGNGTQHTFYGTSELLYISLHQYPFFPGTGGHDERGVGEGEGFTLNIPLQYGTDDGDYREAFAKQVLPAIEAYKPELLMMSAGFDGHHDDPLASLRLSSQMYGEITRLLMEAASKYCKYGVVSVLEGGYNLKALKETVREHLRELADG